MIENKFSWSFSRHKMHSECPRKYYYHYYAFWGGWSPNADPFRKKLYCLRNMKNLPMWAGEIVHQTIKWILQAKKNKINIPLDKAHHYAESLIRTGWQQSLNKDWLNQPKEALNLFEHYYQRPVSQEIIDKKLRTKVYPSLENFYDSGFLEDLARIPPEDYLIMEKLESFAFNGTTVYIVPDLAIRSDFYYLYDWKTGTPSDDDILQLSAYALYAATKWNLAMDQVKIIPVYLSLKPTSFAACRELETGRISEFIQTSIEEMKSRLTCAVSNQACVERFPKTASRHRCQTCFFQEVCN